MFLECVLWKYLRFYAKWVNNATLQKRKSLKIHHSNWNRPKMRTKLNILNNKLKKYSNKMFSVWVCVSRMIEQRSFFVLPYLKKDVRHTCCVWVWKCWCSSALKVEQFHLQRIIINFRTIWNLGTSGWTETLIGSSTYNWAPLLC